MLAIQGDPNVNFDPLKITWLGSLSSYAKGLCTPNAGDDGDQPRSNRLPS